MDLHMEECAIYRQEMLSFACTHRDEEMRHTSSVYAASPTAFLSAMDQLMVYTQSIGNRIIQSDTIPHPDTVDGPCLLEDTYPCSLIVPVESYDYIVPDYSCNLVLAYTPMVTYDAIRLLDITSHENPQIIREFFGYAFPCGSLYYLTCRLSMATTNCSYLLESINGIDTKTSKRNSQSLTVQFDPAYSSANIIYTGDKEFSKHPELPNLLYNQPPSFSIRAKVDVGLMNEYAVTYQRRFINGENL